ncbi:MAG: CPBP family intramembrane glutamic endopeptidase [Actinomycetota bacterium]
MADPIRRASRVTPPNRRRAPSSPIRVASAAPIDPTTAVVTFVAAWLAGQVLSSIVIAVTGGDPIDEAPIGVLAAALIAAWTAQLAGMWVASNRAGTGDPRTDYGIEIAPADAVGLGIGVLAQLVVIPVIYLPLRAVWSDTFTDERLEENARSLVDRADGAALVVLFLLVVVGAPLVEELFYRGLLQGPLAARFNDAVVVVGVAAVFALVHVRPVEFPGLFVFGLILGVCALYTGRLGMAITAHIGFNATGLLMVL